MKIPIDCRKNHILKWKQNGLSMQKNCKKHEISYWSFREWKLKFESVNFAKKDVLVEISATLYSKSKESEPIEIILHNVIRIIVKENSGKDNLKEIVFALTGLS